MKKIISFVLALTMIVGALFSLSGCFANGDKLVCGVTIFENMNEKDEDGNWTGFESEFAIEVGKILGMKVEFQEILWENKYDELNSGAIECIWNGFTANSYDNGIKRSDLVDFSYGYMLNQQCIVVKTADLDDYSSEADLAGKEACAEGGSAGQAYAESVVGEDNVVSATSQINAFTELKSGAVDFIVVDIVLARNLCGTGDFEELSIVEDIQLDSEIYAIGFKKGSDLTDKVNAAIKELEENGKLLEIATKYGFENVLQVTEEIEF